MAEVPQVETKEQVIVDLTESIVDSLSRVITHANILIDRGELPLPTTDNPPLLENLRQYAYEEHEIPKHLNVISHSQVKGRPRPLFPIVLVSQGTFKSLLPESFPPPFPSVGKFFYIALSKTETLNVDTVDNPDFTEGSVLIEVPFVFSKGIKISTSTTDIFGMKAVLYFLKRDNGQPYHLTQVELQFGLYTLLQTKENLFPFPRLRQLLTQIFRDPPTYQTSFKAYGPERLEITSSILSNKEELQAQIQTAIDKTLTDITERSS
jgi:hypothetical protein